MKKLVQISLLVLSFFFVQYHSKAQTTLAAGDIAFTGYISNTTNQVSSEDGFSFVLLKAVAAGTVINFTDNGWLGAPTNAFRTGETTITWTAPAGGLALGTEVNILGTTASVGTITGTVLSLNGPNGDQVLAYQGTTSSPTFISAIHANYFSTSNADPVTTTDANWDGSISTGNASGLPPGLTSGTNAIWLGFEVLAPPNAPREYTNGKFNCSGDLSTAASVRAAVNNRENWTRNSNIGPGFVLPTSCSFIVAVPAPTINTNPSAANICFGANASFTIAATGATAYQWQVNTGSGFANITNDAIYSGATTVTLTLTEPPQSYSTYQYRCVASNGSGSTNSNPATLTITPLPVSPSLLAKTPATLNVADGTAVSATFTAGSGGTGCSDDYRFTTDGGLTYLPYTPGSNISTTGLAAGSGHVFIEGRRANCSAGCQGSYSVLAHWVITPLPAGATTLNAGDIAFSAYSSAATNSDFSFVLLKNVGAGTTISFTDNGWLPTNVFRTGENTITWTAPAGGLVAGTEITIAGLTATKSGGGAAGTVTGTALTLAQAGDQILAYRGLASSPTFISAIHMNVFVSPGDAVTTTAAAWDGAGGANGGSSSALPTGLTTGVNCIWIGTEGVASSEKINAKYGKCNLPAVAGSTTALRAALNNQANWTTDSDNIAPTFTQPTGCNYLQALPPVITVTGTPLTAFTTCSGVASTNQSFSVSGNTLTEGIVITAPTGYQVSTSAGSGFGSSVTLPQSGGTVGATTIYVRLNTTTTGAANGNITCVSGVTTQNVAVSGTVNVLPSPAPSSNSPVCSGNTLNLSSAASTTYSWAGPNGFTSSLRNPTVSNVTTAATGIYSITQTNSFGCTASATTAVTINALPSPTASSNSPVSVNSTLNLSSTGGGTYLWSGPNSFSSTQQNPSIGSVTIAATGTYTVTVTNNGCSATATTAVVVNEATANSNSPICEGATLNLTSGGGVSYAWTGPNSFTSTLQNPSFTNATPTLNGVYTVTVTASGGGTATATTSVTVNTLPIPNPSSDSPKCVGTTLSFNSVSGMTSYAWSGPNSFISSIQTPSISNVTTAANGVYTLTVTNSNGCSASATTSVTINALPVPNPTSDSPKCVGTTLSFNSVSGMTSYAWSGPNSFSSSIQTPSISNVTTAANGIYILTVTNSNGCSASATTSVTINALPVPNPTSDSPKCVGTTLSFNSVSGMTSYAWSGPNSFSSSIQTPSISNVTTAANGVYTLTVVNSNGCSASATTSVTINTLPVPNPSSDSPKCVGTTLSFNSVSGMTSYAWSGPNSFSSTIQAPSISNVTTAANGVYTLTVVNSNGCSASATTSITINTLPVPNPTSDSPKCVGTTLSLNSESGMTSYAWSGPNSFSSSIQTPSISNVTTAANGVYTLTVTNSNGCSASATTSVTINTLPVPNPTSNSPICLGSALNLSSSSANSYLWTGPNSFSSTLQSPSITNVTALAAGTYTITVTNAQSCSATATTVVEVYNPAVLTTSGGSVCAPGGVVNLSATGNGTIHWYDSTTGQNLLATGNTYSPNISASTTYMVQDVISIGATQTALMPNQTSTFTGNARGYYFIAPTDFTIKSLFVPTTASSGSQSIAVVRFNNNAIPPLFSSNTNDFTTLFLTQNNSESGKISVDIQVSAGDVIGILGVRNNVNSYSNSNNTTTIGNYQVPLARLGMQFPLATVAPQQLWTENSGSITRTEFEYVLVCRSPKTPVVATVNTVAAPNITPPPSLTVCAPNTLTLTASGCGGIITWSEGGATGTTLTLSTVGTYAVSATCTENGCTSVASDILSGLAINALPIASPSSNSPVCVGNTLNLSSSKSTSYLWSGPNSFSSTEQNPSISNVTTVANGVYTLTVTNSDGCSASATTSVTINALPVPNPTSDSPKCVGTTLSFNSVSGMTSYAWSGPNSFSSSIQTPSISNVTTAANGVYTLTVTNSNGCSASATTSVTINALPVPNPTNDSPKCVGTTLSFNSVSGMTSYAWSGPNSFSSSIQTPSISNVTTAANGVYTLTVTNSNGCSASATTSVTINALPVPNPTSDSPKCVGTTLSFNSVSGMTSYAWSGPNSFSSSIQTPSISNVTTAANGVYTLTVTNSNGCSASATTSVTINALPVPNPTSDSPKCVGTTLSFNSVSGMTSYAWSGPNSFSSSIQTPSISNVTTAANGVYTLTVTNSNGCSASATTSVTINTLPVPNPTNDSPKCAGTTLSFNSVSGMTSYAWSGPNSFSSSIQTPSISNVTTAANGVYTLTVVNSNGCSASATTSVTINALPVPNPTSDSPKCVGTTLSFNSVSGMTSYAWSGPNSFSSSIQTPSISNVTTAANGVYTLTVVNSNGCSASATTSVTINPLPVPNPTSDSPKCAGTTLSFNSVSGMTSYAWIGPNSFSSSIQAPSISNVTSAANGVYTLTVVNSNGCSASATTSVTIFVLPNPGVGSNSPLCEGAALNLTSEAGGTVYNWSGPNSFTSSLQNPSIGVTTTANAGVYSLTVTNLSGCTSTATVEVVINPLNVSATNTGPYQTNQTITLVGTGGNIYSWNGPNGFTATGAIVTRNNATLNMSGVYTATITNGPCSNTATTSVTVTGVDPCVQLMDFTYVKAGNPYQAMYNMQNGMVINQESFPTSILVTPICSSVVIESVEMNLQGGGFNWNIIQNVEPFALFDNSGLNVFGRTLPPGNYTLAVTGYSQDNKGGTVTFPKREIMFTIVGNMAVINMPTYKGTEFCAGNSVTVDFTTTGTFNPSNQFLIQLSDANGDFANAVTIGTSATAGSVPCTIPLNTPDGENYLIRVLATNATNSNMNPSTITIRPYILNQASPANDYSADKTKKAVYQINATNKVNSPAKVNYEAGNQILLQPGFEVKSGTVFNAEIKGCNNRN